MVWEVKRIIFDPNLELFFSIVDGFGAAFSLDDKDPVRADDQMVDIESIKRDIVVNPIGVLLGPNDLVQLLPNCQFTGITVVV